MSVVNRKMAKEYFENGRRDFNLCEHKLYLLI